MTGSSVQPSASLAARPTAAWCFDARPVARARVHSPRDLAIGSPRVGFTVVFPGVYAVGRPQLTCYGRWMAAVLSLRPRERFSATARRRLCGRSGRSPVEPIEVSVRIGRRAAASGHHGSTAARPSHEADITSPPRHPGHDARSPRSSTSPRTSRAISSKPAINEADKRGLATPTSSDPPSMRPFDGPARRSCSSTLDRRTFTLTDSHTRAPRSSRSPATPACRLPEHPALGQRLHASTSIGPTSAWSSKPTASPTTATPAQQAADRLRDQTHTAAGLTPLRFSHAQVSREPDQVRSTLQAVARRRRWPSPPPVVPEHRDAGRTRTRSDRAGGGPCHLASAREHARPVNSSSDRCHSASLGPASATRVPLLLQVATPAPCRPATRGRRPRPRSRRSRSRTAPGGRRTRRARGPCGPRR